MYKLAGASAISRPETLALAQLPNEDRDRIRT